MASRGVKRIKTASDCISNLPHGPRSIILSKLETKEAVATCILWRRWEDTWALVPNIEISDVGVVTAKTEEEFYQTVNRLLLHDHPYPNNLTKFSLTLEEHGNPEGITSIILAAIRRNVQELQISIAPDENLGPYQLPLEVFTNQNLRKLQVSRIRIPVPEALSFPALEWLHVDINDCDPSLRSFYSKCPTLMELIMEGDSTPYPDETHRFDVVSGSLETLRIQLEADFIPGKDKARDMENLFHFNIDAPNLNNLFIDDDILAVYKITNLNSLDKATVQCGWWTDLEYNHAKLRFVATAFDTLKGLIHARSLELGERTIGALGFAFRRMYLEDETLNVDRDNDSSDEDDAEVQLRDEPAVWNLVTENLPTFPNLTYLKICISNNNGWDLLLYLLQCFPKLETLVIEMVVEPNEGFAWNPPTETTTCLRETIKKVEIRRSQDGHNDGHLNQVNNYFTERATPEHQVDIIIIN